MRLPGEDDYTPFQNYEDGVVLYCSKGGEVGLGWYYPSTRQWANEEDEGVDVIAWMPIPASYKEDTRKPYKKDGVYYTEDGERLYTRGDARAIINGTVSDVEYGITNPYDILPEDFVC